MHEATDVDPVDLDAWVQRYVKAVLQLDGLAPTDPAMESPGPGDG